MALGLDSLNLFDTTQHEDSGDTASHCIASHRIAAHRISSWTKAKVLGRQLLNSETLQLRVGTYLGNHQAARSRPPCILYCVIGAVLDMGEKIDLILGDFVPSAHAPLGFITWQL
jgi:hypothetical protein